MTRSVFQLRCSEDELKAWKEAAGSNVSAWMRRVLNGEVSRMAWHRERGQGVPLAPGQAPALPGLVRGSDLTTWNPDPK
jgi:hypothetical protein